MDQHSICAIFASGVIKYSVNASYERCFPGVAEDPLSNVSGRHGIRHQVMDVIDTTVRTPYWFRVYCVMRDAMALGRSLFLICRAGVVSGEARMAA